jgi:hypothetical protein
MAFLITSSVVSTGNSSSKDFPSGPLAYIIFVRWPCGPCDWASWGKPACHRARDTPEGVRVNDRLVNASIRVSREAGKNRRICDAMCEALIRLNVGKDLRH